MTNPPAWGRYTELRPDELAAIVDRVPVAYLPWGALEWHGPHLPFGVDGFTAEAVAERTVKRTGGVLLPTTWWPITALPHRFSLTIPSDVMRALWDGIFAELSRAGFQVIVLLSGHYAHAHELIMMDAAEHAIKTQDVLVLAVPPLALVDEEMLDHAAHWETALMQALRPRLVNLDGLGNKPLRPAWAAVLGKDPRRATPTQGESALALATERIAANVQTLMTRGNPQMLYNLYAERRAHYQGYVDRYFKGSWEDAILEWWSDRTSSEDTSHANGQGKDHVAHEQP